MKHPLKKPAKKVARPPQRFRDNEEHLHQLAENIKEVFWITDVTKTQMLYISPAYESIWGRTRESLYASPLSWIEAIHPEDRERVLQAALTRQVSGDYDEEYRIIRADGTVRWIEDRAFPMRDDSGDVKRVAGVAADITRRKQIEEAAREIDARKAAIMESVLDGIVTVDEAGKIFEFNSAAENMFGCNRAKMIGQPLTDLLPPSLRDWFRRALASHFAADEGPMVGGRVEMEALRADGAEFPIELSVTCFEMKQQAMFTLFIRDIAKRKRAEEQARLLADAVQSTQELVSITDGDNRFTFVNRAFLDAYGYRAEEILGKKAHVLYSDRNPPELPKQILEQTMSGGWKGEVLNRRKDGTEFPISLSTSQIKDGRGQTLGLVGVARDITERKRTEKQAVAFSTLGHQLSAATAREQAARTILEIASDLFGWDAAYVHLYSQPEDKLIPLLTVDTIGGQRRLILDEEFSLAPTPIMRLVMTEGARLIQRANESPDPVQFTPFGDSTRASQSMMYVPIHSREGIFGILSIQSYAPLAYSEKDLVLLQTLADYCGDALQRIKVADALREAEASYRSIFQNATEGIFQMTPAGRYLSANPALARMFGYRTPEDLIANITDIAAQTYVRPEKWQELKRLVDMHGSIQGFEVERLRRDGSKMWMSINSRAVLDAKGSVVCYEGTNQDITERKRAEAVLRESEQKFRTLFESAPIGIALHDARGRYLVTNLSYQRMVRYSNEELRELGARRVTHPEDVAEGQRFFRELIEGKRDWYQREKRYLRKDGSVVWAQSSASAVRDADGELVYVISMVEDITERKAVLEALRQSERRLRLIAENTTDVIFAFDMDRSMVYVNAAVKELTGYTFSEIQQKTFVNWVHPEDQLRMLKYWDELYKGHGYSDVEFRLITKGGETKWCSSTWGPLFDENGRQIGVQGRERDVTERKQLEREVLESTANERRRIGHELHDGLGQYLAGIAFRAKALEETLRAESIGHAADAKELASLISNAISQTRSLARGLDPIEVETIGLPAALQNLSAETERFFRVTCPFRCSDPELRVDPQMALALYRIVQEAIHNAIKHGEAQKIEIKLGRDNGCLALHVRDNGSGFVVDRQKPSGMGLRVMQYRARSIGASLKIASRVSHGTTIECRVAEFERPTSEKLLSET